MIYRPKDLPHGDPLPYGGSQPEFPFGRESTAVVFSDDGCGSWGFFDPDWVEDGRVRGQLRINIASPSGHGGTGAEHQTVTFWAAADAPDQIVDRVQAAIKFALEEGARQERARISAAQRRPTPVQPPPKPPQL